MLPNRKIKENNFLFAIAVYDLLGPNVRLFLEIIIREFQMKKTPDLRINKVKTAVIKPYCKKVIKMNCFSRFH